MLANRLTTFGFTRSDLPFIQISDANSDPVATSNERSCHLWCMEDFHVQGSFDRACCANGVAWNSGRHDGKPFSPMTSKTITLLASDTAVGRAWLVELRHTYPRQKQQTGRKRLENRSFVFDHSTVRLPVKDGVIAIPSTNKIPRRWSAAKPKDLR